jgi:SAM-dependent methyltransferase
MSTESIKSVLRRSPAVWSLLQGAARQADILKWRLRRPAHPPGPELRLHLGCGDIDVPGFVNIDGRPMPHVHLVQPLNQLSRFASNSASLVYASHCLEHYGHGELLSVLREWCRVLKPGGVVRISVPDFNHVVDMYLDQGRDVDAVQLPLMGAQDYAFNRHYAIFNEGFLRSLLQQAGCSTVRRWQHGTEVYTSLPDWSGREIVYRGRSYPISLNLEGVKS